jgi:hypothetical protein
MSTLADVSTPNILKKAEALLDEPDGVEQDTDHTDVWWVQGSGTKVYRVQVTEEFDEDEVTEEILIERPPETGLAWVTCTCPNGMARGGRPTCYHTAAVLMALEKRYAQERESNDAIGAPQGGHTTR